MRGYAEGVLVHWTWGKAGTEVGVVAESLLGGKQLRVRFDDGSEQIFASDNKVIKRFFFEPGAPVRKLAGGDTGVIASGKMVGEKIYYTISLPGNRMETVSETTLRPATLTDPVQRLKAKKVSNPRKFCLRSTAARYSFISRYDELASLDHTRIEPKPHQISVAHRVTNAYPHRFLLCDEVGLGKTIEAGMILRELRARGMVRRVLVLVPANLQIQWQHELKTKFNESFSIYNGDSVRFLKQGSEQNVWTLNDSIIASHGFCTYNDERVEEVSSVDWDVVIVDEAHHARVYHRGSGTRETLLYKLAKRLTDFREGGRRSVLLLTATPMQLDPRELYSLVDLLDPALFPSVENFEEQRLLLPELNRLASAVDNYESPERVASHLGMSGGKPTPSTVYEELKTRIANVLDEDPDGHLESVSGRLETVEAIRQRHRLSEVMIRNRKSQVGGFQPRQAFTWPVEQTADEKAAYAGVEEYVREGYQKALETQNNALGFVMVTFQKLMASSSRALRSSLIGRRERLLAKLAVGEATWDFEGIDASDGEDASTLVEKASSDKQQYVSPEELQHLDELIDRLGHIREDSKARALLSGVEEILESEPKAKILIFTQFRETQEMLKDLLGSRWSVHLFHGQIGVLEKDRAVERFRLDEGPSFLISTEAGGEGRNLQFCHLLVNYDLPWNPMRVEQRIGRVDRFGQKEVVTVFNFSVAGTVEERVLDVLERRIGLFKETVGGLDPILGEVETDLRKIFQMAEKEAKRALEVMANSIEKRIAEARKAEVQLADFIMDSKSFRPEVASEIMDREKPVSRQAMHDFAKALLEAQRTILKPTETQGVYEAIFREPFLSDHADLIQDGGHKRLVCFDPTVAADSESVQFLSFGHPIVDALVDDALDNERGGLTAIRHIRGSNLPPGSGYQFNFVLSVGGINSRKEVFPVYVNDEGDFSEEIGKRLLDIEARFDDERGNGEALDNMEGLDEAFADANLAAALALERLAERTSKQNRDNLKRERAKLERYFDYRDVVAGDKASHASRVLARLEASDDPAQRSILPVWRANLENAIRIRSGLADEKARRLTELDRLAMPETGFSLLGAARVVIHPPLRGEPGLEDEPLVEGNDEQ